PPSHPPQPPPHRPRKRPASAVWTTANIPSPNRANARKIRFIVYSFVEHRLELPTRPTGFGGAIAATAARCRCLWAGYTRHNRASGGQTTSQHRANRTGRVDHPSGDAGRILRSIGSTPRQETALADSWPFQAAANDL